MSFFYILVSCVILQRLIELIVAHRNERWLKSKGAYEVGREHYKYIVIVHFLFLSTLIFEVVYLEKDVASWWWLLFSLFICAQVIRVWSIYSLGRFWNTRIIILPGTKMITKGPYRFLRHPNYVIVATEILVLPLLFQAYYTAILFTIVNAIVLAIRIPTEEQALAKATNYTEVFQYRSRFIP